MYRIFALLFVITICFVASTSAYARTGVQMFGENSKVNWDANAFIAVGEGAMPSAKEEPNRARAYLKAKTYARMAAMANLMMAAEGATIEYEANGKDFAATETVRQKVKGIARTVQVVETRKEQVEGGTIVVVKVKAPVPAELRQQASAADVKAAKVPEIKPVEIPVKVAALPDKPLFFTSLPDPDAYTSLVIDARGCGLERCMSPKIRTPDGREVWGTVKVDYDFVEEHGIVAYARSMSEARNNKRCGSRPLIIRANKAGGRLHADPVISSRDADFILAENSKYKFLDEFRVVFIKD